MGRGGGGGGSSTAGNRDKLRSDGPVTRTQAVPYLTTGQIFKSIKIKKKTHLKNRKKNRLRKIK